jgi:2-hydroxycyclohexanecarboxyl-CoA dehydrogenase
MFELTEKVAVVTGGARGLGRSLSMTLAKQGAKVVIADVLVEEARKTAQDIVQVGGQATAVTTDVTDLNSIKSMLDRVHAVYGLVDVLVNNAGWDKMSPFSETTPAFWDKVIAINYKGVLNCVYAVMGDMVARNSGKIINIASDAGRVGSSGEAVYSGAKGAVIAFSKAMARELARNQVNVNVVCPGPLETPLTEEMKQESALAVKIFASMDKIIPLRRMGMPQDIAGAVVFLASEEAAFITGQVLSVSGGLTMM